MWEPRRLTTLWASTACYRDSFTFYLHIFYFYNIIIVENYKYFLIMVLWVLAQCSFVGVSEKQTSYLHLQS
jgi:hypothetical protein